MSVNSDYSELLNQLTNGTSITFTLIAYVLLMVAWWMIFSKAGEPGWAAVVPIYNTYVLFKITLGRSKALLFILLFIPVVNIILYAFVTYRLCRAFGKGVLFFIVSLFFPNITTLIMGFGGSQYSIPYNG